MSYLDYKLLRWNTNSPAKSLMGCVIYKYTNKWTRTKKDSNTNAMASSQMTSLTVIDQACHIATIYIWLQLLEFERFVINGLYRIHNLIKKTQNRWWFKWLIWLWMRDRGVFQIAKLSNYILISYTELTLYHFKYWEWSVCWKTSDWNLTSNSSAWKSQIEPK